MVAAYGCRELIEMGAVDILQTDINHVGGISALWKVAAMANISNISIAPHACEGPIGVSLLCTWIPRSRISWFRKFVA